MIHSAIMVAGDNPKHLAKINELKADIVIINLEDAVYDKEKARNIVVQELSKNIKYNKKIIVRINSLDTYGKDDIKAINHLQIDGIRIPKIKTVDDVKTALNLINEDKEIHLSIETKEAMKDLANFKINHRVTTVYLGILDLLESLDLPQSLINPSNPMISFLLSDFLIKSKTAGLNPISFVYQDYKNLEQFKIWCNLEKTIGLTAKCCISPTQVGIANEIFKINNTQINKAKQIKLLFETNRDKNAKTGFTDDKFGFIDEPIYKNALNILKSTNQ